MLTYMENTNMTLQHRLMSLIIMLRKRGHIQEALTLDTFYYSKPCWIEVL